MIIKIEGGSTARIRAAGMAEVLAWREVIDLQLRDRLDAHTLAPCFTPRVTSPGSGSILLVYRSALTRRRVWLTFGFEEMGPVITQVHGKDQTSRPTPTEHVSDIVDALLWMIDHGRGS